MSANDSPLFLRHCVCHSALHHSGRLMFVREPPVVEAACRQRGSEDVTDHETSKVCVVSRSFTLTLYRRIMHPYCTHHPAYRDTHWWQRYNNAHMYMHTQHQQERPDLPRLPLPSPYIVPSQHHIHRALLIQSTRSDWNL